ncbi:MAG: NAD(P)H-hydrate epimerase [Candidatus Dormibacteraceae bacterium]
MADRTSRIDLVPAVTAAQMREIDRRMTEDFGISLLQMMENAGRAFAELTRLHCGGLLRRRVVVLAGRGGNGGGGMAAARRLANWGAGVRLVLAHPDTVLGEAPARQLASLRALGVSEHRPAETASILHGADVVLDALLGYSLEGPPREPEAGLIRTANSHGVPILALDLPSGLDPDRGVPNNPTIRATRTLALALPKAGLLCAEAALVVGELWLADISVPPVAYAGLGIHPGPLFAESDLIRITRS